MRGDPCELLSDPPRRRFPIHWRSQEKEGFIAIEWNQITDLAPKGRSKKEELSSAEQILEAKKKELKAEETSVASVAGQAGQICRFGFEMQEGDRVLAPLGEGRYLVGEVGAY